MALRYETLFGISSGSTDLEGLVLERRFTAPVVVTVTSDMEGSENTQNRFSVF